MPISPYAEKAAFWRRIRGDPYILEKLGLSGADEAQIASRIVKRRQVDEPLDAKSRYINIYHTPSRKTGDPAAFVESVMQVDVLVPASESQVADEIMGQVIALLANGFLVNGKPVRVDADAGDQAPPGGFYSIGYRFSYFSSTVNKPKTV